MNQIKHLKGTLFEMSEELKKVASQATRARFGKKSFLTLVIYLTLILFLNSDMMDIKQA